MGATQAVVQNNANVRAAAVAVAAAAVANPVMAAPSATKSLRSCLSGSFLSSAWCER